VANRRPRFHQKTFKSDGFVNDFPKLQNYKVGVSRLFRKINKFLPSHLRNRVLRLLKMTNILPYVFTKFNMDV
jgi:hypothetical protein